MTEHHELELLERIETYYDAMPRFAARTEDYGSLTLFVNQRPGWHYYARPRRGAAEPIQAADVAAVRARQRELGIPEAFEWVAEVTPSLRQVIEASGGLPIQELPLMVMESPGPSADGGPVARIVEPDTTDLATLRAVANVGFASPGTQIGTTGREALPAAAERLEPAGLEALRDRLRSGLTVMAVAGDDDGPLSVGSHQPVDGVTEVVGVATLPAARRRGLCAAVTRALVADAQRRGCDVIFLSADGDDIARLYGRIGFRRIATALIAEAPE